VRGNLARIVELVANGQVDVLTLQELRCNDHAFFDELAAQYGWLCYCAFRPRVANAVGFNAATGGVAVIVTRPALFASRLIGHHADGYVSVELSAGPRSAPFEPILVSSTYLAPAGSVFEPRNDRVTRFLHDSHVRARDLYAQCYHTGDFNYRLGSNAANGLPRRSTTDNHGRQSLPADPFPALLARLHLAPAHGRAAAVPARCTSRALAGRAGTSEVDYILTSLANGSFACVLPVRWSFMGVADSHRPISLVVALKAGPHAAPRQPPPAGAPKVYPYLDVHHWEHLGATLEGTIPWGLLGYSSAPTLANAALRPSVLYRLPPPTSAGRGAGPLAAAVLAAAPLAAAPPQRPVPLLYAAAVIVLLAMGPRLVPTALLLLAYARWPGAFVVVRPPPAPPAALQAPTAPLRAAAAPPAPAPGAGAAGAGAVGAPGAPPGAPDVDVAYHTLLSWLEGAVKTAFPPPARPPAPSTADAAGSQRYLNPRRGINLPPFLVEMLARGRAAARAAGAVAHGASRVAALAAARAAQRAAGHMLRRMRRARARAAALAWGLGRIMSPRAVYAAFARRLAPHDPTLHVPAGTQPFPSEEGFPPAHERFPAAVVADGTAGPVPPAVGDPRWLAFVPHAPCPAAGRLTDWREIFALLFPSATCPDLRCPATGAVDPGCPPCAHLASKTAAWRGRHDLVHDPPLAAPTLNTASGSSGAVQAPHVVFARFVDDPRRTFLLRKAMATVFAACFNAVLTVGRVPAHLAASYARIFVPKPAKPGAEPAHPARPDTWRSLSLGNLISKVLSLLLANRLTHWACGAAGILGSSDGQGGFVPGMGVSFQLYALFEGIKAQWRADKDAVVLWLDLRRAYDSVHPEALCAALLSAGLPANIVALVKHWASTRVVSVTVNGVTTSGIPIGQGVGQGDPASCVLFAIMMSSLLRLLALKHPGIHISPALLGRLAYADDLAGLGCSSADVAAIASTCWAWADAWGLSWNLGETKTAVTHFPSPKARRAGALFAPPAPVSFHFVPLDGSPPSVVTVPVTRTYHYLGADVKPDLGQEAVLASILASMSDRFSATFGFNSLTPKVDPVSWRALVFMGLAPHLLAFASTANAAPISAAIRRAACAYYKQPASVPTGLLLTAACLPSGYTLVLRARVALYFTLLLTPFQGSPGPALLRALVDQPQLPAHGVPEPWHAVTWALIQYWVLRGVPWSPPRDVADVRRFARCFARAAALLEAKSAVAALPGPAPATLSSQRPAPGPPLLAVACTGLLAHFTPSGLGPSPSVTPVSYTGPGGTGNLFAQCTAPVPRAHLCALMRALTGALSLRTLPLAPASLLLPADASSAARSSAARGEPCPLCNVGIADPYHVLCECADPEAALARAALRARASAYLPVLAGHLLRAAHARLPWQRYAVAVAHHGVLMALLHGVDWASPSGCFLLHRLCVARPWPAAAVDDPDDAPSVARAFGALFDALTVRNVDIRRTANSWCLFAGKALTSSVARWGAAVDAKLLPPPPPGGAGPGPAGAPPRRRARRAASAPPSRP